jgi:hypothetical protein
MEVISTTVDIRTRAYLSCGVYFDIRNIKSKECFFDKREHWISYTRASVSHGERLKGPTVLQECEDTKTKNDKAADVRYSSGGYRKRAGVDKLSAL